MHDPRIDALADILIRYSVGLQPKQTAAIAGPTPGAPLLLALYRRALEAGAYPYILPTLPDTAEIFYRIASDDQLQQVSPITSFVIDTFDSIINVFAPENPRALTSVDPRKPALAAS